MRVSIADVDGVPTRYYHAGAGPPLLLVHGVGVTADAWFRNIDALAADFAVYAPDFLDNGFTGQGAYTGGPPQPHLVAHLAAFADHLGLGRFAVAGSSFGGLLAALLYLRLPRRVSHLVLISSGTLFNTEEALAKTLRESFANGLSAISDPSWESCRRRLANVFHDAAAVPDALVLMQLTLYARPGSRESYERRMRGLMDAAACRPYRVLDRLHEIAAPTLLVWGRQDPRTSLDRARAAAAALPDARLAVFDDCGHLPHLEHPGPFNALVRAHLKGESLAPWVETGASALPAARAAR